LAFYESRSRFEKGESNLAREKETDVKKYNKTQYWLKSAEDDWQVSRHLFEKGDYSYSLFFGHLTIEKILRAIYANRFKE